MYKRGVSDVIALRSSHAAGGRSCGVAPSPGARGCACDLAEGSAEMCLVHEAARERDLAQAFGRGQDQLLCSLNPCFHDVGMWGLAEALFEGTGEVARTERNKLCQIPDEKRPFQSLYDIALDLPLLPGRQSATCKGRIRVPREFARKQRCETFSHSRCIPQITIERHPNVFEQFVPFDGCKIFVSRQAGRDTVRR